MPWQQLVADVALEVDPDTGQLWYEEVIITVPRQSGKTTLIMALMIWRCVIMARRLGRQVVTYLAQTRQMARRKLEREFLPNLAQAAGFTRVSHARAQPVKPTDYKPSMNNGNEHILWGTGSYLQIDAPTEKASHGDVLDMPVIDEAFAHTNDLVEQAVDAASVTRQSPQSYVISTAGNERSTYLWSKVLAGRSAVKTPGTRTAYFEWSVPHELAYDDPAVWRDHLPALGHTITEKRLLARLDKAVRNPDDADDEGYEPGLAGFRRGYMNQWMKTPKLGADVPQSEISSEVWMSSDVVDSRSQIVGRPVLGVAVAVDGISASVVIVGRRVDGLPHVETLLRQSGTWWLEKTLREFVERQNPTAVAWHSGGPARVLQPDIERAVKSGFDTVASPLNGREWSAACEGFALAVKAGNVRHLGDVILLDAIQGASRREVRAGWEWDMREARSDITPLAAATAALRALELEPITVGAGGFVDLNDVFSDDDD
jgi:hypothetical protein